MLPGQRDAYGGWSLCVPQLWWGHRAEKMTLLYIVGCEPRDVPSIPFVMGRAPRVIDSSKRARRRSGIKSCTKPEREATPPAFAAWLVELARRCRIEQPEPHESR